MAEGRSCRRRSPRLSGTPHHQARFENILHLLRQVDENKVAGRVIFRTKESVRDWHGRPLFPSRNVRVPSVVHLRRPLGRSIRAPTEPISH
jgi:hypothetical protein